ncbi:MAG TPA: tripartite tricarboxylate transporter substrate binding protein [Burkholderiales bacterium]|nr:tripartite tricarboxylate transporter substrate binding protein [Burkholderiales bacterium]
MTLPLRAAAVRSFALVAALFSFAPLAAHGQAAADYPSRPVKIISPFAPGGMNDFLSRLVGQKLSEMWKQPVVVENRGGSGGTIGVDVCAKSPPDGYTIALGGSSMLAIAPSLYSNLPYSTLRDLAPVISLALTPYVVAINPYVPARNVKELIALARSRKSLTYGSSGVGSMSHLAAELLRSDAGIELVHVPYRGTAPAVTAMISGEVDMMVADLDIVSPHAKAGKLRLLAVTSAKRSALAPQLPTMQEEGLQGYVAEGKFGFVAPAGTPKDIVAKLNDAITQVLKMPDVRQRLQRVGAEPMGDTPEQYAAALKADIASYKRIIERAKIKADL